MLRRVSDLISVSRSAQEYVRRWSGLPSTVIHPDVYARGSIRRPDPAEQRFVTMINPSGYKGIDVFLALADALPQLPFLAVPSWATTESDRAALAARPNIELRPSVDDMDLVYGRTRVLLMPSLWDETFGYCAVEAMLRGIPVLAADVAGLREAMLGTGPLLPVHPIERYSLAAALPRAEIPPQEVGPWLTALRELLDDRAHYLRRSSESRFAADEFVSGLDPDALGRYLSEAGRSVPAGVPR
jgi:glycosyltransferase involved in cell wall biosynthesis